MADLIEVIAGVPGNFIAGELDKFKELVARAGEVGGAALSVNIANARVLVMLEQEGVVRGVAAIKRPQDSYRAKIVKRAGVALPGLDYPYELGYVFLEPSLQRRGLSHRLVSAALVHSDGAAVFATVRTDNVAMRTTLCRAGFVAAGHPYLGLQGRSIGLLLRQRITSG